MATEISDKESAIHVLEQLGTAVDDLRDKGAYDTVPGSAGDYSEHKKLIRAAEQEVEQKGALSSKMEEYLVRLDHGMRKLAKGLYNRETSETDFYSDVASTAKKEDQNVMAKVLNEAATEHTGQARDLEDDVQIFDVVHDYLEREIGSNRVSKIEESIGQSHEEDEQDEGYLTTLRRKIGV